MKRIMITAVAGAAALAGSVALAAPAMASNGVTVATHIANAPDTTSGTVTSNLGTGNGYVWAFDNITKQFTVTQTATGYKVDVQVHGSYSAFSDPNTGSQTNTPIDINGPISGVNTYYVTSMQAPNPAAVPVNEPDGTGTQAILDQLFGSQEHADPAHPDSGNLWVFTYKHAGNTMTQTYADPNPAHWGDITGAAYQG